MNYTPLAFTLGFLEVLVFLFMVCTTIWTFSEDNQNSKDKVSTANYFALMACCVILMLGLSLGAGKAFAANDNIKVEQEK